MSSTLKHWVDMAAAIATILATVATPVITFITAVLGAVWYSIRIYDWWKGKQNANVGND